MISFLISSAYELMKLSPLYLRDCELHMFEWKINEVWGLTREGFSKMKVCYGLGLEGKKKTIGIHFGTIFG